MNIHKAQGLEFSHVTIYFDVKRAPPGVGYVAISRVAYLRSVAFLGLVLASHFCPVRHW